MTEEDREREKLDRLINQLSRPDFVCVCSERFCIHWQVYAVKVLRPLIGSQPAGDVTVSAVIGYEAGYKGGIDECVEKVRSTRDRFQRAADASSLPNDLTASRDWAVANALTRLLGELESLTLDQVALEKTKENQK